MDGEPGLKTDRIDELVRNGPIHSGSLIGFLQDVFLDENAQYDYRGLRNEKGHALAIFGYKRPVSVSHFFTETGDGESLIGYEGTVGVDPVSAELEYLDIASTYVPDEAGFCSVNLSIRYGRVRLQNSEFSLPANVLMDLLQRDNVTTKSDLEYKDCP